MLHLKTEAGENRFWFIINW